MTLKSFGMLPRPHLGLNYAQIPLQAQAPNALSISAGVTDFGSLPPIRILDSTGRAIRPIVV